MRKKKLCVLDFILMWKIKNLVKRKSSSFIILVNENAEINVLYVYPLTQNKILKYKEEKTSEW